MSITPFTQQLLSVNKNAALSKTEYGVLGSLIDYLLEHMGSGHSCINLQEYCDNNLQEGYDLSCIVKMLEQSSMCAFYSLDMVKQFNSAAIASLPLSVITVTATLQLLYLTRYFYYELGVVNKLKSFTTTPRIGYRLIDFNLNNIIGSCSNGSFPNTEQLSAIKQSALNQLSFLTGGPGTGKTTTVIILLILFLRVYQNLDGLNIHICAPTGKAAIRVKQSISSNLPIITKQFALTEKECQFIEGIPATTIHKLLGYKHGSIYFKYRQDNLLDLDILIIDETSMVGLPLFFKLLSAIDSSKIQHLIFLGDKNQLSSVEEGYVFSSLMQYAGSNTRGLFYYDFNVSQLTVSKRNLGDISEFASAVLHSNFKALVTIINKNGVIACHDNQFRSVLSSLLLAGSPLSNYVKLLATLDLGGCPLGSAISQAMILFKELRSFAILSVLNSGLLGVNNLNVQLETLVKSQLGTNSTWYSGRPILILQNNAVLGVYNGDIGICMVIKNKPVIFFEDGKNFIPEVLPKYQLAYAITVHKAQGSEYEHVYIVLPDMADAITSKQLFSRELLYTAVTRARARVTLYTKLETLDYAINNKTWRGSGIEYLLR